MTFNHMDTGSVPVGRTNKEIKFSNAPEAHVDGPSAFNGKVEGSRPSRRTKYIGMYQPILIRWRTVVGC